MSCSPAIQPHQAITANMQRLEMWAIRGVNEVQFTAANL